MSINKKEGAAKRKRHPAPKTAIIDKVGHAGVYPMSGPTPAGDAPAVPYQDHGESELHIRRVVPERCRDIMTKDPAFCQAKDPVAIAGKLMQKHDIGVLPVVENLRTMKLAGIVTDRDLAMRVLAEGRDPHTTTIDEIMSHPVVTCSPDDDLDVALNLMERHQLKRIPAVDKFARVVGMISQADIARWIPDAAKIAEMVTCIAQPR